MLVNIKTAGDLAQEQTDKLAQEEKQAQEQSRKDAMLTGAIYTLNGADYQVSFTKDDGDGLVQVKSAFELGLTNTNIHFENGTVMPINAADFPDFALWFVNQRNGFFV